MSILDIAAFRAAKQNRQRIAVLTAYDYPTGRLVDEAGIDLILVGDSVGMVVLGYPDTTSVTMEAMLHHTRAVARGVKHAPIIADLPFGSYDDPDSAVTNSRRLIEAGANAVKLEGGTAVAAQVRAITAAGIPFVGHIGMLPQHVKEEGGYKIKGKTEEAAALLLADAKALEEAGAFAIVLELVAKETTKRITESISIPTIGIGSGPDCDGDVLVLHDLVGLFPWFKPKFAEAKAAVGNEISAAVKAYIQDSRT